MCNLKYDTNEPICETEDKNKDTENRLVVFRDKGV